MAVALAVAAVRLLLLIAACSAWSALAAETGSCGVVSRASWGARPPKRVDYNIIPLPYAVVLHSVTPPCRSEEECVERARSIESHHRDALGWDDIGPSFLVGGDGRVYEGAGWLHEGAHTVGYNRNSVGVMFIGDFSDALPPRKQLEAAKRLLRCGAAAGLLSADFKLLGHRQVAATRGPGLALFQEIQTWPWWSESP